MKLRIEPVFTFTLIWLLMFGGLAASDHAQADELILSGGSSITSQQPQGSLSEYNNHSAQASLRYEGEHYGLRVDRSYGGDDAGNTYITGDSIFRVPHKYTMLWPINYAVAGAGIMVARHQLRQTGSYMNFHAMAGFEYDEMFGRFGGMGIWFDHWSNGHIHAVWGPDNVPNPPRNVVSVGYVFPF